MRLLNLREPPGSVFGREIPRIGDGANEGSGQRAVTEIDEIHCYDLVDDSGHLARGFRAFKLNLQLRPVELVDDFFEDRDEDDILLTRVLKMEERRDHFPREQSEDAANILFATLADSLRLLFGPSESEPGSGRQAVEENRLIRYLNQEERRQRPHNGRRSSKLSEGRMG